MLNSVLSMADTDRRMFDFVIDREGATSEHIKIFGKFFTNSFLYSVAATEKSLVQKYCDGKYLEGEVCGLDYSPLNCVQSAPDLGYFFRTLNKTKQATIISVSWNKNGPPTSFYRMKQANNHWVIDGIQCVGGKNFNW